MEGSRAVNEVRYAAQGAAPAQPPKTVNPSCFGNIEDVTGSAESAAGRVERLINRLIGEEPQDVGKEPEACAFGLFNVAEQHARDIRKSLQRIFYAVDRIEKHLP